MNNSEFDVFISYRREDGADFSEGLANCLTGQGYRVFFDKTSLRDGSEFPDRIEEAIHQSREFILIITKSYFGKDKLSHCRIFEHDDWVRKEIEIALECRTINFFPIIVDCEPPLKDSVPKSIRSIVNKNYIFYNRSYDTYELISSRLIKGFSDSTKENATIGIAISHLSAVNINDNIQFNLACKQIIKLIKNDNDEKALIHILTFRKASGKRHFYNRDYRFVVFYTLFTYYRRMHQTTKLVDFVDEFGSEFLSYPFNDYVMVEYSHKRFYLALTTEEETKYLHEAIKYSKRAVKKLRNNNGIVHSFSYAIALALENNIAVDDIDVNSAIEYVNEIINKDPNYGGMYYSTRARLLSYIGKYGEALRDIKLAQTLEVPNHSDWMLRVATYQKYETLIKLKMLKENIKY